jgi:uncharacterized membrane protein
MPQPVPTTTPFIAACFIRFLIDKCSTCIAMISTAKKAAAQLITTIIVLSVAAWLEQLASDTQSYGVCSHTEMHTVSNLHSKIGLSALVQCAVVYKQHNICS